MINKPDLSTVKSILFVCMGNICRSPCAEAVFRQKAKSLALTIDSAGTLGSHAREKPDHRAQKAGIARGYSFDKINDGSSKCERLNKSCPPKFAI